MTDHAVEIPEEKNRHSLRFPKRERLCHRTLVTHLFDKGKSEYAFPLRVIYKRVAASELERLFRGHVPPLLAPAMMMVTVPKKKFRHAVDRVWLRRRIREAYRLNRDTIPAVDSEGEGSRLLMAFIYVGDTKADYARIVAKMRKLLENMPAHPIH